MGMLMPTSELVPRREHSASPRDRHSELHRCSITAPLSTLFFRATGLVLALVRSTTLTSGDEGSPSREARKRKSVR